MIPRLYESKPFKKPFLIASITYFLSSIEFTISKISSISNSNSSALSLS